MNKYEQKFLLVGHLNSSFVRVALFPKKLNQSIDREICLHHIVSKIDFQTFPRLRKG
jgi:hypothetical protein